MVGERLVFVTLQRVDSAAINQGTVTQRVPAEVARRSPAIDDVVELVLPCVHHQGGVVSIALDLVHRGFEHAELLVPELLQTRKDEVLEATIVEMDRDVAAEQRVHPCLGSPTRKLAPVLERGVQQSEVFAPGDGEVRAAFEHADECAVGAFADAQGLLLRIVDDAHLPRVVEPGAQVHSRKQPRRPRANDRKFPHGTQPNEQLTRHMCECSASLP